MAAIRYCEKCKKALPETADAKDVLCASCMSFLARIKRAAKRGFFFGV